MFEDFFFGKALHRNVWCFFYLLSINGLHTDSAEYKMWGNGIALPCAAFVLGQIARWAGDA
jgi:hypothetical protein